MQVHPSPSQGPKSEETKCFQHYLAQHHVSRSHFGSIFKLVALPLCTELPASLSLQQETRADTPGQNVQLTKFKDPKTHKLMTMDEVKKHKEGIADLLALLQKSKKVYKDTMRRLGDKEAAQAASYEITGGLSKMWDKACDEGHIICMVVTCPSAADYDQMKENEEDLRKLIYRIDPQLTEFLLDIFISRLEIGKVRESTAICRWPMYFGESVNDLAASLCTVSYTHLTLPTKA